MSRIVLEANTFAKTKQMAEEAKTESRVTAETTETVEKSSIECTPMKASKPTNLMDVTFSPIVNRSVLQSSSESISVSERVVKSSGNESSTDSDLKPLPAFTTIHEVYTEKSVLRSYHSSVAETSMRDESRTEASASDAQPLPVFTTINETDFDKSVLMSYDSSVAESSADDRLAERTDLEATEPFVGFKTLNETEFGKSVLGSHSSSVAETSRETRPPDTSSLLTSDSEFEARDDRQWKHKYDSENAARHIQREKERIVEIEREINEIEGDFSEDGSTDEEIVEGVEEIEEEETSEEESAAESSNDEVSIFKHMEKNPFTN